MCLPFFLCHLQQFLLATSKFHRYLLPIPKWGDGHQTQGRLNHSVRNRPPVLPGTPTAPSAHWKEQPFSSQLILIASPPSTKSFQAVVRGLILWMCQLSRLHSSGEASTQPQHNSTINLEYRGTQLYSQMMGVDKGYWRGIISQSTPMTSPYPCSTSPPFFLAWFSTSLCILVWPVTTEKSECYGISSEPGAGDSFLLAMTAMEKPSCRQFSLKILFKAALRKIKIYFFPEHTPWIRCRESSIRSQTLVSNIRHLYSNYNHSDPMCLGFNYLELE